MDVDEQPQTVLQTMETKLKSNLKIDFLEFIDTSGNCGSSYSVTIVSPDFNKKMTLARHKLVNQILSDEIAQLHAFSQVSPIYHPNSPQLVHTHNYSHTRTTSKYPFGLSIILPPAEAENESEGYLADTPHAGLLSALLCFARKLLRPSNSQRKRRSRR
uniref:BolA protein n=1 Tax=Kwoniella dejecticola CBS 10117 TaxID=1296121 RepID=A0A1A6A144_9TREE|nr:uncharacterized protein I303_06060 [Kwoniella dejecticola CBS 10117]OBR83778.1 hypothetical protein I303_06060 [Kwoniella dejecticola CBS 10117]